MDDYAVPDAADVSEPAQGKASISLPAGAARLDLDLTPCPGGTRLQVVSRAADGEALEQREVFFPSAPAQPRAAASPATTRTAVAGFAAAALAIYLLVRLIGLDAFPIYFFTDEAIQTVLAADLVRDGFRSYAQELLPTFLQNGGQYNLSVSVYLQVLPYLLFGKSVWVTRAVSVLLTWLAAWSVWRMLRDYFHSRYAWLGILVLSALPAWFLHSRTAFETATATSFYAGFLYLYMKYRCESPRSLFGAVVLGALAFYTYSPMQLIMLVTAALLLVSDAGYHWRQRRIILGGVGLVLVLALPYFRFLLNHPDENLRHMQILSSYWIKDIPTTEKLALYFAQYARGLDPRYWYLPNDVDFVRHQMKNYGHLMRWMFPLLVVGLGVALRRVRSSPYRVVLIALLAAPSGAALVHLGVTRALAMVIPAGLLTALGLSWLLERLERVWPRPSVIAAGVFALLVGLNGFMLWDALHNGPTWFHDYDMGGMQYGARQVFPAVIEWMEAHPDDRVMISPSWANGTDVIGRFFQDPPRYSLGSMDGFLSAKGELDDHLVLVMIPEELDQAARSGKFDQVQILATLAYPDGRPGFYFTRLHYAGYVDDLMAAEAEQRRVLREDILTWNEQPVFLRYSLLDMGQISDAFDGDDLSVVRTLEANPLQIDISFPQPRLIQEVTARVGGTATRVTVYIYTAGQDRPQMYSQDVIESPEPREVKFKLPQAIPAGRLRVEVLSIHDGEPTHVHLWEIRAR